MLREWIRNIVVFLLLMTLIGQLIPEEKYHKYIRLTMGMILILVLLMPISRIFGIEDKILQNYIRNQLQISAADVQASGKMFNTEIQYNESYKKIIMNEIEVYFEVSSMSVQYCQIDMNDSMDSEEYGDINSIAIGITPKDKQKNVSIPEEKIEEWKQDLSTQFGVLNENVYLEIVS